MGSLSLAGGWNSAVVLALSSWAQNDLFPSHLSCMWIGEAPPVPCPVWEITVPLSSPLLSSAQAHNTRRGRTTWIIAAIWAIKILMAKEIACASGVPVQRGDFISSEACRGCWMGPGWQTFVLLLSSGWSQKWERLIVLVFVFVKCKQSVRNVYVLREALVSSVEEMLLLLHRPGMMGC